MKVLIATDTYSPDINGVVTSVKNLYEELIKLGHDVKILTLSKTNDSYTENNIYYVKSFRLEIIYPDVRGSVSILDDLLVELIDWEPDVIHTQSEFFTYSFAKHIAKKVNSPMIHTYHTMYEHYTNYLIKNELVGRYLVSFISKSRLKDIDTIVSPTLKVKNKLVNYNINSNIEIVPTGIDFSKFGRVDSEKLISIREKYNIGSDKKVLLFLGRIGEEKNLDELVRNFKVLRETRDDVVLMIVGGGPYFEELQTLIGELGLNGKVITVGMVKPDEIANYYGVADIFVNASQSETQGLTYIEALANGLPAICKYDESLDGVLIDGHNGYFFETVDEFVMRINSILDDSDKYKAMSTNAVLSSSRFSKEEFAKNILKVYNNAITRFDNYYGEVQYKYTQYLRK